MQKDILEGQSVGHSGIAQETGACFKLEPIDKLTQWRER